MKRAVVLCLSLLTCLVLSVECDDEGTLSTNDEGNNDDVDSDFGLFDGKSIENNFDVTKNGALPTKSDSEIQKTIKCLVCKGIVEVMLHEIKKVNPKKKIEVKSDKSIQYVKSESYLSELMEDLCEYQDTFANLRQVLVQKTFIQTMLDNDGDPNASPGFGPEKLSTENVNFLCLEIMGESDDAILAEFQKETLPENLDDVICRETVKYCVEEEAEVDNNERDEL